MKPIVRWTIGNAPQDGISCLKYSIMKFYELYGGVFDYYLLFNSRHQPKVNFKFLNVVSQINYHNSLPVRPSGVAWKLYPPRLNIEVPEIFIDNDLVIYKKLEEIESLLTNNISFITGDKNRLFGNYSNLIKQEIQLNSGLFSLPSNFDFKDKLFKNVLHNTWQDDFDEQGLVSKIMIELKSAVIPIEKVNILGPFKRGRLGTHGTHFVMLNREKHLNWIEFSKRIKNLNRDTINIL